MIRAPMEVGAGLFLIGIGAIGLWQGADLSAGTLNQIGPGMLPRALAVLTIVCGLASVVGGFMSEGAGLDRWHLRGPVFILGAAVLFGLTVRPLGLAVAAPLAILVGAFASDETRLPETAVFAVVITIFCLGLFKYALGLPIPVAPWLIGY
jgi:putative tricarboxylic transport membrane protein